MTTDEMDTKTDLYAKSDSTSFPADEKLDAYVEADGILNALIIKQQEDRNESEVTDDTVDGQNGYDITAGNHHTNWLKIDYGDGFIPARHRPEQELISEYGTELEGVLAAWPVSEPIYFTKGSKDYVYPAPDSTQAGTDRLKRSIELLPADLDRSANDTPTLVPTNFHYLHCAYAAMSWLDEDDPLFGKAKRRWDTGVPLMLETIYPRDRQDEIVSGYPDEDGTNL